MADSEVRGLETTIQKTNEWINEISEEIGCMDKEEAYLALSSTLHALRDRLMPEEAVDLGAQLPMLIRGIYYEGYTMSGKPLRIRSKDDFIALVGRELRRNPEIDPEEAAEGVFAVLEKKISKGEIKDIKSQLPRDVKELWH
jgi:uncharacterized protein (DUF2267 family)